MRENVKQATKYNNSQYLQTIEVLIRRTKIKMKRNMESKEMNMRSNLNYIETRILGETQHMIVNKDMDSF